MADRYWIASSAANWDNSANWSTTSGGSGGASVPGNGDTAIFDSNGLGDCTISNNTFNASAVNMKSGYTGTFSPGFETVINGDLIINGGTLDNSQGKIRVEGPSIEIGSGATLVGDDTVFELRVALSQGYTIQSAISIPFNFNVVQNNYLTNTLTVSSNLVFSYNFSLSNGYGSDLTFDVNDYNIEFRGDINLSEDTGDNGSLTWTQGTGTVTFSGSSNQSVNFLAESVEDIDIDKTGGTVTLTGGVDTDSLTLSAGTLDIDGQAVDSTGNLTMAAGTVMNDTAASGTISIGGSLDINGASGTECTWSDADIDQLDGTGDADYCTVSNSNNSSGTDIDATDNCTDGGGNTGWTFSAGGTTVSVATDMDALISKSIQQTLSMDALVSKQQSIDLSIDAILQAIKSVTADLDAVLSKDLSQTLDLDALLQVSGLTQTVSIDALLERLGVTASTSIDALIQKSGLTKTVSLDAILYEAVTGEITTSLDALIQKAGVTFSCDMDALISKAYSTQLSLDALVKKAQTSSTNLDALLSMDKTENVLLDALLQASGITTTTNLDALISQLGQTISTVLDAILMRSFTVSLSMDALISGTLTQTVMLDALIGDAFKDPIRSFVANSKTFSFVANSKTFSYKARSQ